jgi:hypothetical protein
MSHNNTGEKIVKTLTDPVLNKLAKEIRNVVKRTIEGIVTLGGYLDQAKKHAGRGPWLIWLKAEFDLSEQAATNFINLHKAYGRPAFQKFGKSLPVSALYLLASPDTPKEALDETAKRIDAGETPSVKETKKIVKRAKRAARAAAETPPADEVADAPEVVNDDAAASAEDRKALYAKTEEAASAAPEAAEESAPVAGKSLEAHWARASQKERADFLDLVGVDGILAAMSNAFGKALRGRVPGQIKPPKKSPIMDLSAKHLDAMRGGNGSGNDAGKGEPAVSAAGSSNAT